ncbi:hypothetical protein JAAARDRAFT_30907 [Jaapia argillacea MUCL 33604]|uniref:Uncharacterized protein n=1 Tax=Jaapia argillacea MUCL 33604 TaxID=933084 RepID=A0A067Q3D4_9AGAM|nr:hypothetical protein JAAARDRAFT_30907 [Jaapia argillacea MUCL 33604]
MRVFVSDLAPLKTYCIHHTPCGTPRPRFSPFIPYSPHDLSSSSPTLAHASDAFLLVYLYYLGLLSFSLHQQLEPLIAWH